MQFKVSQIGRGIKMVEEEYVELTSPHKHIKNTPTCEAILAENQLETGRRSPTQPKLQGISLHIQEGQKKISRA